MQGYAHGAMDYILATAVPEILRANAGARQVVTRNWLGAYRYAL
jgi:hypothetical protein